MGTISERSRAEDALNVIRDLARRQPDVFGSGLTRAGDRYAVEVFVTRRVSSLPNEINGVPVVQRIGAPPAAW